jgi:hypothetical protein
MTSPTAALTSIIERWRSEVEIALAVPTEYPGQPLQDAAKKSLWARVYVPVDDQIPIELAGRTRHAELLAAQLFFRTPVDFVQTVSPKVYAIAALFRRVTVSGATFRAPSITFVGVSDDPARYQVNIVCPFFLDEDA